VSTLGWLRRQWSRLVAGLAFTVVATVTGVVSYIHIEALTVALHQHLVVARLMPLGIDGLIVVGSVALLQAGDDHPHLGWLCVGPGAAASLFANVESGIRYGLLAAGWAGMASVGFFLATFTLERWLKAQAGRGGSGGQPNTWKVDDEFVKGSSGTCSHHIASSVDDSVVQAFLHHRDCLDAPLSQRQLSATFDLPRTVVRKLVGSLGAEPPEGTPEPSLNGASAP
jgi:hypothetical protein